MYATDQKCSLGSSSQKLLYQRQDEVLNFQIREAGEGWAKGVKSVDTAPEI